MPSAPINSDSHLYLIDASAYIFRAYHALPPLTRASDGLPVGAVSGFCNMLWKLLEDLKGDDRPTHFACVFDKSSYTFRNEMFPDYKANRSEPPDDLRPQFPLVREAAIAYWGIGRHMGVPVSQNAMGHLLGHVIDIGRDEHDPNARIYQTNARQYYHSDSCDIVGLLCWRKAKAGGLSTIVSSVTLYNEVAARAPELAHLLFEPFHFDRRGEVPPGQPPWYYMPICSWHGGRLSTHHVRRYIESARRFDDVPPLTDEQTALLDLIDQIVDDPDIHLSMAFEPGDIQLLHNPQIRPGRTGFEDVDEPERRRRLLGIWLCATDGRALPEYYAQRWGSADPERRGGVVVEGQKLVAPLEP